MKVKNELIWNWFEQGEVREALLGEGHFFIPDELFGRHNQILVIDQLFDWACERNKFTSSAQTFEETVDYLCVSNRIYDTFKLVLSYSLISDDRHEHLPVKMDHVIELLAQLSNKNGDLLSKDSELRNLVLQVSKRFPKLIELIGLKNSK
jgi:hypothetical protein